MPRRVAGRKNEISKNERERVTRVRACMLFVVSLLMGVIVCVAVSECMSISVLV